MNQRTFKPTLGTFLALLLMGAVAFLVVTLWHLPAQTEPRFALRDGVTCGTCHINPTGGGARNDYGRYVFAPTRLPMGFPAGGDVRDMLDIDLGRNLTIGADARMAYIKGIPPEDDAVGLDSLFLMQADFYLAAMLFDGLTLYYDQGVYGSFEAFGMYRAELGDPRFATYAKLGYYIPAYGLRLPNHSLFGREEIGFGPRDKDTGIEIGAELGPVHLQFGAMNGMSPDRSLDDNSDFALVGRAEWFWRGGPWRLMLGASIYRNLSGPDLPGVDSDTSRTETLAVGGHWGLAIGRFNYIGDLNWVNTEPPENSVDEPQATLRTFNELGIRIVRGLELILNHEFREPDLDFTTGTAHRITAGIDVCPMPQLQVSAFYRRIFASGRDEAVNDGTQEIVGMVHFFY